MKCSVVSRIPDGKPCDREAVGTNLFGHWNCAKCLADVAHLAQMIRELNRRGGNPDLSLMAKYESSNPRNN